jgi:type IV pilus assembly protein PilA
MSPSSTMGCLSREKGITLLELAFILAVIAILAGIAVSQYSTYRGRANDAMAKEDLKKAYDAAATYFTEHPNGKVTKNQLGAYGFMESADVDLQIFNDTAPRLLMGAAHRSPGSHTYLVNAKGNIAQAGNLLTQYTSIGRLGATPVSPEGPGGGQPTSGDLITPQLMSELLGAYAAALAFYADNPGGVLTKSMLEMYGYTPNINVSISIIDGTLAGLSIVATSPAHGGQALEIGPTGAIH